MHHTTNRDIQPQRWLFTLIFIHIALWTCVPAWIRFNLPMDSIEGVSWGHQLEWGYDKNPFLNGWLTGLVTTLTHNASWSIYLLSQLSVGICFFAVWRLANKILPPLHALLAVLLLEGIQYYHLHALDFNDNTLELSVWALTILFYYHALQQITYRYWILTGLCAGLAMMTKYYSVLLLVPMWLFLLLDSENRRNFCKPPLYAGFLAFLIVILPHCIWLFFHDFITVKYAIYRVSSQSRWFTHFTYPGVFVWQQFEVILPSIFLLCLFCLGKKPFFENPRILISHYNKKFLLYLGLGPLLCTLLLSCIANLWLRAAWGQPLFSLFGILLIAYIQPHITLSKFYRFIFLLYLLLFTLVTSYAIALLRANAPSSANFPGKIIAETLTQRWHQQYHTPLRYVAGSTWLAGNIAYYSPDHPAVYIDWDSARSPWIDEKALREKGAIFVWDSQEDFQKSPSEIKMRFPTLHSFQSMHFAWMRNQDMLPIEIKMAYLPPK